MTYENHGDIPRVFDVPMPVSTDIPLDERHPQISQPWLGRLTTFADPTGLARVEDGWLVSVYAEQGVTLVPGQDVVITKKADDTHDTTAGHEQSRVELIEAARVPRHANSRGNIPRAERLAALRIHRQK